MLLFLCVCVLSEMLNIFYFCYEEAGVWLRHLWCIYIPDTLKQPTPFHKNISIFLHMLELSVYRREDANLLFYFDLIFL